MSRLDRLTDAQRTVVTGLDTSFCVTSGAGCGKTRVLVERYIEYLEKDLELPLERLAAITFTENAAAEMRDRIRHACREQAAIARRSGDAHRARLWLKRYWDVDVAPIDTIHGFSASLLRRYPIEAGVDPNFSLLDEAEASLLRQDVVAEAIERLLGQADPEVIAVLEHLGLDEARRSLAVLAGEKREVLERVAAPVLARTDEAILRDLKKTLDERTTEALNAYLATEPARTDFDVLRRHHGAPDDKLEQTRVTIVALLERLASARTADVARQAAAELVESADLRGGSARRWKPRDAIRDVKAALRDLRDGIRTILQNLPAFDYEKERRHLVVARALYRTAMRVAEAYEVAKEDRSALDFEDLLIRARNLLRDHPPVLRQCRSRFRAILVDELQDTNLLQFEIVDLLTGVELPRGRRGLRPGAFFGVGDPKQSIYRFRGAEVEVFERALARVGPAGRKGLGESFRLHTGTAALANRIFAPLMGDRYEPVIGRREQKNRHVAEVLAVIEPPDRKLDAETGHAVEAARIAERLEEIVAGRFVTVWDDRQKCWRPAQYGDAAILMRRMTYLHLYEEALQRRGIPYYVVAGSGFYRQQEVLDVLHLLRAINDPEDDLHLAGVLRSPFFAVSDEGLYHLRQLGLPLWSALAAAADAGRLSQEDLRGVRRAASLLPAWAAAKDRTGLAALVDQIIFDSGYAAAVVGRFGGERAYANLRQLADLARRFEQRGLYALGDFIDYVSDFMNSQMREQQAPLEAAGGEAVQIMTIHKAKGLEFPIVVVPDTNYHPAPPREPFFINCTTGLAVRLRDEGEPVTSAAMALARLDDSAAQRDEEIRLFYVAMTRARDYLVFTCHQQRTTNSAYLTWMEVLLGKIGAELREGDRTVRLPGGESVWLSVRLPAEATASRQARRVGPRDAFCDGRVLWDRVRDRAGQCERQALSALLEQVEPVSLPDRPPRFLAATALATYCWCPRLYWLSEVLGVEDLRPPERGGGISARQWGRAAHRAMELASSPDPAVMEAAVSAALRELDLTAGDERDRCRQDLLAAVRTFWQSEVGRAVAKAKRTFRETPFILALDNTQVRGTIDLVYETSEGLWAIVDYKSSARAAAEVRQVASQFDVQLGLYALAVQKWCGRPVSQLTVHFLGSGQSVTREADASDAERAGRQGRAALAGIATGVFAPRQDDACRLCRYHGLCNQGSRREPA